MNTKLCAAIIAASIAIVAMLDGAVNDKRAVCLMALDGAGNVYVAGRGDDDAAAFAGKALPRDWRRVWFEPCIR